nr:hypothetical protein [Moraxella osloensis]
MVDEKGIKIAISIDYGAEEYIWNSRFVSVEEVIDWFKSIDQIDIEAKNIFNKNGSDQLILVDNDYIQNIFYSLDSDQYPHIMLENDYTSYLYYKNKKYFHKGFKGEIS